MTEPTYIKDRFVIERAVGLRNREDSGYHEGIDLDDEVTIERVTVSKTSKQEINIETFHVSVAEFLSSGDADTRFKEFTALQQNCTPKLPISSSLSHYIRRLKGI